MADQEHCKHESCRCATTRSDGYCSDACAQNRSSGGRCACGHGDCR
ncbi:MAG TPA: hypothetical protein VH854_03055 [Thermoanaerobaculia bacterium]|nr:hypothetical protein [Thermoanaerobaculia bacterium]